HIGEGIVCDKEECNGEKGYSIYNIIKKEFKASYIFIPINSETDYSKLISVLELDSRFNKVYWNNAGEVWELK
ncbi:MAG: hypothetical protein U9P70_04940, partial [Patescibacteria group bacterium]|nr:hypothetical protein [Patescibacteria group bacterium]